MVTLVPRKQSPLRLRLGARLFVLYMAAGGIPILLAAVAGTLLLRQQSKVQGLPAFENILEASLRGHRRGMDRIERALEGRGTAIAHQLGTDVDLKSPEARAILALARTPGIDVAALFALEDNEWTRLLWEDALGPPPEPALVPRKPTPSPQGPPRSQLLRYQNLSGDVALVPTYLWGAARDSTAVPALRGCLLLGSRFAPGFFDDLETTSEGLVLYRRFQDLVRLSRLTDAVVLGSALLVSLALGLLLARRLARGITHPVDELVRAMSALGLGRDIPAASSSSPIPEMEILRDAFDRMRRTLGEYEMQLRDREQLKGAQQTARYVAHEIRNALTPVQAGLAVLARRVAELPEPSRPQGERALEAIQREASRMTALAGAFSEYAQLPDSKVESLRIGGILADLVAHDLPTQVQAIVDLQPNLPLIEADRDDVERLLRNLLKNAVESMNGAGRIWTSAHEDPENCAVVVVIRDEGEGMDERTLQQIYQPGFTTKPTGTGLGLPLVRRSMLRYGGRIEVQSTAGVGTKITLRFPVSRGSS